LKIKYVIIILAIIFCTYIIFMLRREIRWFIRAGIVTYKNQKGIKKLQKVGMNKRNLTNEALKKYIKLSKQYISKLKLENNRVFEVNPELERHLRYSRFSEKYVLELFNEIINYMRLDSNKVALNIKYISSKTYLGYAGLYSEKGDIKQITINIRNDMTINTIISVLAHEATHHLLLSNGIKLQERIQNECLTDVAAVILGFGKYMVEGYKIANNVIYDEINKRTVNKDRVGYLTYKDIKYVIKEKVK